MEQIVVLLRQIEMLMSQGKTAPVACREAGISQQSFYRWRREYGGLELDQAKRMKDLERENGIVSLWEALVGACFLCVTGRRPRLHEGSTPPINVPGKRSRSKLLDRSANALWPHRLEGVRRSMASSSDTISFSGFPKNVTDFSVTFLRPVGWSVSTSAPSAWTYFDVLNSGRPRCGTFNITACMTPIRPPKTSQRSALWGSWDWNVPSASHRLNAPIAVFKHHF